MRGNLQFPEQAGNVTLRGQLRCKRLGSISMGIELTQRGKEGYIYGNYDQSPALNFSNLIHEQRHDLLRFPLQENIHRGAGKP